MADLTGKAFDRAKTPVLNLKAVQKSNRNPDPFVAEAALGEKAVWDASQKLTGQLAQVFGGLERTRQQEVVDGMELAIQTEFIQRNEQINNTMTDMDAADLNATEFMSDYNEGKLVMPDGSKFGIKPIEEYKHFEGLSPQFKSKIKKYYNTSKQTTEGNLMKQFSALSKSHNKMRLNKLSHNVSQEVLSVLSQDKNWNKEAPMADYLKTFLADSGSEFDEGMHRERYKKYIFNRIREGDKSIPGAGEGGSKPEDIGIKTGLTDDANRQINVALERLSERVFDAVDNSSIDFDEANTIINANMQQILLQQFQNHANQNEPAAIDKARTTGYRYTREYDGQGRMGSIEYVLEPATLNRYIQAYDRKDKEPDQDLVYEALQVIELTSTDGIFNLNTKIRSILNNPKFTTQKVKARMVALAGAMHSGAEDRKELADSNFIFSEIEQKSKEDPNYWYQYGSKDPETGLFKLKSDDELKKLVPDKINKTKEWILPEGTDQMEGRWEYTENTVKGSDRDGVKLFLQNKHKIIDAFKDFEKGSRVNLMDLFLAQETEQLLTSDSTLLFLDEYASEDSEWTKVDDDKVDKKWENDTYLQGLFENDKVKFIAHATKAVTAGNKNPNYNKTLSKRLFAGSDQNDKALFNAIKESQRLEIGYYSDVADGASRDDLKRTDPIDALEKEMKQEYGQKRGFTDKQKQIIKRYTDAHSILTTIGMEYKNWDAKKITANQLVIKNKGDDLGKTVMFFGNKPFAMHILKELNIRQRELNSSFMGAKVLITEMRTTNRWQIAYPSQWVGNDEEEKINNMLKFLSHELKGTEIVKGEPQAVDYLKAKPGGSAFVSAVLEKTDKVATAEALEREKNTQKAKLAEMITSHD